MARSPLVRDRYLIEIEGVADVISQLRKIKSNVKREKEKGLKKVVENNLKYSRLMSPPTGDGVLYKSIKVEYNRKGVDEIEGYVTISSMDCPYLLFVYYGTGKYAQLPYTPGSYGLGKGKKGFWYVHRDMPGASKLAKYYKLEGNFYKVTSSKANPFLENTYEFLEAQNLNIKLIVSYMENVILKGVM